MTDKIIQNYDVLSGVFLNGSYGGTSSTIDLWEKGSAPNRFSLQFRYDVNAFTNKTFTTTDVNTTDDTITIAAHGYQTGLRFTLTTSGTLPSPLLTATGYFVIFVDANTFKIATTKQNAADGIAIDLTTVGTGTQTVNVSALSGGSALYQASNNGSVWTTISTQTVTATGGVVYTETLFIYRYIRVTKNITNGSYVLKALFFMAGDYT